MFLRKGSLFQVVVAAMTSLFFLFAAAWFKPYVSRTANMFKVGTELALLMTLYACVLLKIDLDQQDIPGGEAGVSIFLIVANFFIPLGALAAAWFTYGSVNDNDNDRTLTIPEADRSSRQTFANPIFPSNGSSDSDSDDDNPAITTVHVSLSAIANASPMTLSKDGSFRIGAPATVDDGARQAQHASGTKLIDIKSETTRNRQTVTTRNASARLPDTRPSDASSTSSPDPHVSQPSNMKLEQVTAKRTGPSSTSPNNTMAVSKDGSLRIGTAKLEME